jgi:bifunctional non-homologous end joining protein LigD
VAAETEVDVGGRRLRLSNLDKPLYPSGFAKGQVIHYYASIAAALLPHLQDRPLTLIRYPNGVDKAGFFAKRCPPPCPGWLRTFDMVKEDDEEYPAVVADDAATLVWLANLAAIELHVPLGRAPDLEHPDGVMFDLDPGPPAGLVESARLALHLRDLLGRLGLRAVVKTTGGKGLHVLVPLDRTDDWEHDRAFASAVAELLQRERPDEVVTVQTKAVRGGKVLVDWTQNHIAKTNVAAYSLRAKGDAPTVSTPLAWEEVEEAAEAGDPELLVFGPDEVLERVRDHGDLWADALGGDQHVPGGGR